MSVFQNLKTGVRLEQYSSAGHKKGGAWLGKNRTSGYRYYLGQGSTGTNRDKRYIHRIIPCKNAGQLPRKP